MSEGATPAETPEPEVIPEVLATEGAEDSGELANPETPSKEAAAEPSGEETTEDASSREDEAQRARDWYAKRREASANKEEDRLDRLRRERKAEEERLEALRRDRETAETQPDSGRKAPTLEDYDFDSDAYMAARIKFEVDERMRDADATREQRDQEMRVQEMRDTFNDRARAYASEHEDYTDLDRRAEAAGLQLSSVVSQVLLESERGPQLHHELLRNPDKLDRINGLSPIQAVRELSKMEISMESRPKPTPKPKTSAPPVIDSPIRGGAGGGGSDGDAYDPDDSMEEFARKKSARWNQRHNR